MVPLPGRRTPILLELDLTSPLVEPPVDPLSRFRTRGQRQLRPTLRALHDASEDNCVVGLIARVGGPLPWPVMQELRLGVQAFAASGKPAYAWAETFGEGPGHTAGYVLATAFDQIWLQPGGGIGPLGVAAEATFLRGALDKLGVEPELEQRKDYKNAANQFTQTELTPAHREALERVTDSVFTDAVEAIAAERGLDPQRVRELADTGPRTAAEAREVGLVDRLGYRDQAYAALRDRIPDEAELLYADRWRPRRRPGWPLRHRRHVALVTVRGLIASGHSRRRGGGRMVGSDSVGAELRAAVADEQVGAVVLQIDSGGGSAIASETMWREVCRVREAGKPVVVSMGGVAASGGYYIACPADVIVALPATLTGSIGVLGGKFVVRDLLDRLGVTTGSVQQGARSLMYSPRRGFTDDERERMSATIDAIYDDFVAKVAEGRHRTVAHIEAVAQGRVWTGRDAVDAGLVDELGGLRTAVRIARDRAGLSAKAPVRPALHVPPLARLGTAKNSEDPRALLGSRWLGLRDVVLALGVPADSTLLMPSITLQ